MPDEPVFATDLYRGTAGYYDRYRLPYPEAMIEYLIACTRASGSGRLLDLACGTGQLAFPLRHYFSEVWAVDREPDMIEAVSAKAEAEGAWNIRPIMGDAETLEAEAEYFELAVIGNAFHRLQRDLVSDRLLGWLKPGGCAAMCWSYSPHEGEEDWQRTLVSLLEEWRTELVATDRVPTNWEEPRKRRPDHEVLSEAGFEVIERQEFEVEHLWSLQELAGFIRSTSYLPAVVLGERGAAFDDALADSLGPLASSGGFHQTVSFACEVARKPG